MVVNNDRKMVTKSIVIPDEIAKDINVSSILIVDDNIKNLQVLGGLLQNEKMLVEFALDGKSALNWLIKKNFDLILLDINMPGLNGYEVCAKIKKDPVNCEIPIIFITANTDSESIIKGFEAGGADYITKPFIQGELLARVKTQLNIKKSREQIIHYLHEIEEQQISIKSSINYARSIQNAILSKSAKNLKYLPEHFILFLPKDIVSGDYYWVYKTYNKLIMAVMDCTGHGVPGAFMSILGTTLMNEIVKHDNIIQPDKILESLRLKIINVMGQKNGHGIVKDGIEGSVICFDLESKILQYAGSYIPLVLINDVEIINLQVDRIPIGYFETIEKYTLHEIEIKKNDCVYMFTDGIIDQFGGQLNKKFMIKKLRELLFVNHNMSMTGQKELLTVELKAWMINSDQTDDILVLGIRF
jgi:sigma-B regulation protein RsbU (phosphoserine phosphatase)